MSGFPGSGKSTLARKIALQTGAVVIDHDVIKSALLEGIANNELDLNLAGKISYQIDWALVESNLAHGKSVILDSPCLYEIMIEKGTQLAEKYGAMYKYVECFLDDFHEINHRLKSRKKMISQISEVNSEDTFQQVLSSSKKPENLPVYRVKTNVPLESYLQGVLNYIAE